MEIQETKQIGNSICKFCGNEREADNRFYEMLGVIKYQECDCEESIKEREKNKLEEEARKKDLQASLDIQKIRSLYRDSGMTRAMKEQGFKNYNPRNKTQQQALRIARAYSESLSIQGKSGLYFYGEKGLGKTHLARAIANETISSFRSVKYVTSGDFRDLMNPFNNNRYIEDKKDFQRCDLFIFDGLGDTVKPTANFIENLNQIIDFRTTNKLPTIITSNFTINQVYHRLKHGDEQQADNTVDRLVELCHTVFFDGTSYRE